MQAFGTGIAENVMRLSAKKISAQNPKSLCQAHALERKPSNAWARKIPALTKAINTETVSIIANVLCALQSTERPHACTVKKIHVLESNSASTDDLLQQVVARGRRERGGFTRVPRESTDAVRLIHHAGALPISAVFELRYLHALVWRWAAPWQ